MQTSHDGTTMATIKPIEGRSVQFTTSEQSEYAADIEIGPPNPVRTSHCWPLLGGKGAGGKQLGRRSYFDRYEMRLFTLDQWTNRPLCAEVRFKNDGLDSIEVQDNGSGIDPQNYESIGMATE